MANDYEAVNRLAERARTLAEKYNFPPQRAHALTLSGWAQVIGSDSEAGLQTMEIEFPKAIAIGPLFRYYPTLLADARMRFGRITGALTVLRTALETVTEPGVGSFVSELYRLQGLCLLRLDPPKEEEAMSSLRMAVDIAKQQKATLYQLKAAINMAEAAITIGQPETGLKPLADLCANIPEEFDALELEVAKRLLAI